MVRIFHCKNRIKIVVFAFSMIAARPVIWSDCRCLMISRLGGCWVLLCCFLGASGGLLGVSWVFPGWSLGASWLAPGRSWVHSGRGLGAPGPDFGFWGTLRTTLFVSDVSQQARGLRLVVEGYFPITMASYSSLLSDHLFPHLLWSDYLFVYFPLHLISAGEEMIRVFAS